MSSPTPSRVYLDAGTVAPVRPAARDAWLAALDEGWADPRRLYREGRHARHLLDAARQAVAACLTVQPDEVVFTSSHREAVSAAVDGVLAARTSPAPVVHSAVEHSAVISAAEANGIPPVSLPVDRRGRVDVAALARALEDDVGPALVCVQSAGPEVGTRQPIAEVADRCRHAGVPLLVDAAAVVGNDVLGGDKHLMTADPRSWGSVPGAGVLVVPRSTPWLGASGDGPERVEDSPALPAVFAAAVALQAAQAGLSEAAARRHELVARIRAAASAVPDTDVVGDPDDRLPHVVTFSCLYVDGDVVVEELDRRGFAVGSGSACTSARLRPSHVLAAMGVLTHGNVRVGLPHDVDPHDVDRFCAEIAPAVAAVRARLGVNDL